MSIQEKLGFFIHEFYFDQEQFSTGFTGILTHQYWLTKIPPETKISNTKRNTTFFSTFIMNIAQFFILNNILSFIQVPYKFITNMIVYPD